MQSDFDTIHSASQLTEDEFARRYTHPFLVIKIESDDEGSEFQTIISSDLSPALTEQAIVPVAKRSGANGFSFITVGRAQNNDIIIGVASVSKCHAFIQPQGDRFTIADAGSKNGTQLNGDPVNRHDAAQLDSGDKVTFSPRVTGTFMDARAAHAWLRSNPALR